MNVRRVRKKKAEIVTTLLTILRQTKLVNPSLESLEAAREVEGPVMVQRSDRETGRLGKILPRGDWPKTGCGTRGSRTSRR